MDHPAQWAISGLLAAVFVVANYVNASLLLRMRRGTDESCPRRCP